ncbi:hypothetical protein Tco_0133369 [Tanacetum coccineum]
MDDELMWAADRVVAPTPGSAITIPEIANEFAIKGNHLTLIKGNQFEAVEVPQTLEYRGGQLNATLVLEVENFTNWKKRFMCHIFVKSTWDDLILYHEGPSDVKESRVMDLKLCYSTFKFKEGETLTQTFTRYKALMNELVNDGIKLSKLKINTGFINGLPKKWLSFCQSLKNTNHVKDSKLASLFGKLKYEENLIDSIYETKKNKSLVSITPLSTAFVTPLQWRKLRSTT